ncbi:M16 family metallopeptidase [Sphingobacterium nematocida]|nr:M16 family metallopeptidase [Sphingobacterium nematocida]
MKYKFLVLIALWVACVTSVNGQVLPQDSKLVKGQLKNGFRYYIYPDNGNNHQSYIQLFVNAGSLQEREDQLGLAHFVEHMAFNGSKNYPKNEVITYLESLGLKFGADLNAHTSYDETVYKITIDTKDEEHLHKALDIVYDWGFHLSFDSLEIEKERGVIIEEWRTKQGVSSRMSDQSLPLIFYNSRYADRRPIGSLDILRHFQRPTIVDFYQTWYRPDLMGIAIVTNQDVKRTEQTIKRLFSRAKKVKGAKERVSYRLAAHQDTLFNIYTDKEATSIDFSYITKLPAMRPIVTEADFKFQLSRSLTNALIKKRFDRIAQLDDSYKSASMSFSDLLINNGLSIGGAVLFDGHIIEGISKFLTEKERLVSFGFTSSEIDDYKEQFNAQLARSVNQENNLNPALLLGQLKDDFFSGHSVLDKVERRELTTKLLNSIDSITLREHLATYFQPGNTVVLLSAPERLKGELPTEAQLKELFSKFEQTPVLAWKDELHIPSKLLAKEPVSGSVTNRSTLSAIGVEKWELSNGVNVYLKNSTSRKGYIQLTGFRKGGYLALDTADYVTGVFVKNVLGASGTGDFSRQALTKYLNGNSASATFMISNHREGLSASANMKDVQTMFELLYSKWTQPRVDERVFSSIKKKSIDAAKNATYNVTGTYSEALGKAIGADSFDENTLSAERIEKDLQIDRIIPVFNSRFGSPEGFDFVIVGDFTNDSLKYLVEKYIGGLPQSKEDKTAQRLPSYDHVENQDILMFAGKADKATVNIFFQTTDYRYEYPGILLNEVVENIIKIKLRKNLREENSGVYGVGVSVSATSEPTTLLRTRINFTCEPARKDFLIEQAYAELRKIAQDSSYFSEELHNIKKQMQQSYDKQYDKDTFWSAELRNHVYYKFSNWNYFTSYTDMLQSISAQDVSHMVADKILKAKNIKAVLMPENLKK